MTEVVRSNPAEAQKSRTVAEVRAEYLQKLSSVDASKQKHFEAFMAGLRMREKPQRDADSKTAENALARLQDGNDYASLDKIQKNTLQASIDKFLEENPDTNPEQMRDFTIGSIRFLQSFKENYALWKSEYEKDSNPGKGSLSEYVQTKALAMIESNRGQLLKWRVSKIDLSLDQANPQENQDKRDDLTNKLDQFIFLNKDLILGKDSNPQAIDELYKQFKKIFVDSGFDKIEEKDSRQLFDQLIADLKFSELVKRDVIKSSDEMIKMIDEGVVDIEEWNSRRLDVLKAKKFTSVESQKPEVKSDLILNDSETAPVGDTKINFNQSQLSDLRDSVGWQSLEPVGSIGDQFRVVYDPQYNMDRGDSPVVEIKLPSGSTDIRDATFKFQDTYQDRIVIGKNAERLHGQPASEYSYDELKMAYNKALLDNVMNQDTDIKALNLHNLVLNDEINDDLMMDLARGLFGEKNVDDHQLTPLQMKSFKYLVMSILKAEREGKFTVASSGFHESIKNLTDELRAGQHQDLREFYLNNYANVEGMNGNYDKVKPFNEIYNQRT